MDEFDKRAYVREVMTQCRYAVAAIKSINNGLLELTSTDGGHQAEMLSEVFRNIHSFLTHSSNVSLLFWPTRPRNKRGQSAEQNAQAALDATNRGEVVRGMFDLVGCECLEQRNLRDHLEHFDERLDEWRKDASKILILNNIAPESELQGVDTSAVMRWFDPYKCSFHFRGEIYNIQQVATAIEKVFTQSVALTENYQ